MESDLYVNPSRVVAINKTRAMLSAVEEKKKFLTPDQWLGLPDMCWGVPGAEGRVTFWSTTVLSSGKETDYYSLMGISDRSPETGMSTYTYDTIIDVLCGEHILHSSCHFYNLRKKSGTEIVADFLTAHKLLLHKITRELEAKTTPSLFTVKESSLVTKNGHSPGLGLFAAVYFSGPNMGRAVKF